jgi:hypothetical protein
MWNRYSTINIYFRFFELLCGLLRFKGINIAIKFKLLDFINTIKYKHTIKYKYKKYEKKV